MDEHDWLAERFQAHRSHLRAVAYRLLGSLSEADDAVQETWLHLSRAPPSGVDNLGRWLTTVVARVCLDALRSRAARREELLGVHLPDPIIRHQDALGPEEEALLAEGVGLALLVVMEQLAPAERLALVLHDTFAVPFEEIAAILGRSPAAARQLASRARRRVRASAALPNVDLGRQRKVVDAFLTAARDGDLDALVAVLDPEAVVRADWGGVPAGASRMVRGARAVAEQALSFSRSARFARPALVNGAAGVVADTDGDCLRCWASRSGTTGSWRSTSSPTPHACAGLSWPPWTTDAQGLSHASDARPDPGCESRVSARRPWPHAAAGSFHLWPRSRSARRARLAWCGGAGPARHAGTRTRGPGRP
jgi:RNA polymerase sigma factor (sigma-70 family)